jgi:hypothetical protein
VLGSDTALFQNDIQQQAVRKYRQNPGDVSVQTVQTRSRPKALLASC